MVRISDVFDSEGNLKAPKKGDTSQKSPSQKTPPPFPSEGTEPSTATHHEEAAKLYGEGLAWVEKKFKEAETGNVSDIVGGPEIVQRILDCLSGGGEALLTFTATWKDESYLYPHSVNVAIFSLKVGQGLHLRETELQQLGIAALLHDTVEDTELSLSEIDKKFNGSVASIASASEMSFLDIGPMPLFCIEIPFSLGIHSIPSRL